MYLWHGICLTNSAIPTLDTVYGTNIGFQKPVAGSQNLEEEACSRKPESGRGSLQLEAGHPESIIKKQL